MATQLAATFSRAALRQLSSQRRGARTFTSSLPLEEMVTIKVPTMGDSITEGTIVEWVASIGQAVKEDDVVALVETDKVTIDIKAEVDGVIVQHFGEVDDNVEVGANLYEIDTEGTATEVVADEPIVSDSLEANAEPSMPPPSTDENLGSTRIPSIKFLNKDGWNRRKNGLDLDSGTSNPEIAPVDPKAVVTLDSAGIGPTYGRPPFTEREIEALLLGGASEEPTYNHVFERY